MLASLAVVAGLRNFLQASHQADLTFLIGCTSPGMIFGCSYGATAGLLEGLRKAKVLDEVPELLFLFRWNLLSTSNDISAGSGSGRTY